MRIFSHGVRANVQFRDQLIAAPLKQICPLRSRTCNPGIPRSADRGPIEALFLLAVGCFAQSTAIPRSADRGPIEAG